MSVLRIKSVPLRELSREPFCYPAGLDIKSAKDIIVEIGPGRGDFLFHIAASNPSALIVGIEIKRKRVDKLIARAERKGLKNVMLIQDDARHSLPAFFADGTVSAVHIYFPDPWPKLRHAKNRAISHELLSECARCLKTGGSLSFATDFAPYAESVAREVAKIASLKSVFDEVISANSPDEFPTFFAMKWRAAGRKITYQRYKKI